MNHEKYDLLDFDFDKIKNQCESRFFGYSEKLLYLQWVLKAFEDLDEVKKKELKSDFEEKLRKEYIYYKERFEIWKERPESKIITVKKEKTLADYIGEHPFRNNTIKPKEDEQMVLKFSITEIKEHLKNYSDDKKKVEYLDFLKNEFTQICYHYTDDDMLTFLKKYNLEEKYKSEEYSAFADFENSNISISIYRKFRRLLRDNIIPYISNETNFIIEKNKLGNKENHYYKNAPEEIFQTFDFNYSVVKTFCYNNLQKIEDRIRYLSWVRKEFYIYFSDKKFILEYKTSYKTSIEQIEAELEHLKKEYELNKNESSNDLIDENANTHPRFDYDVEKIIKYSKLFTGYQNKMNYLNSILDDLERFAKPIEFKHIQDGIKKEYKDLTDDVIKVLTDKQFEEHNEFIKLSNDKIIKIKEEIKEILKKKTSEKKDIISKSLSSKILNADKIRWLIGVPKLKKFLNLLQEYDFIDNILEEDPECENYSAIFVDENNNNISELEVEKIQWRKNNSDMAYLIREITMPKNKFIPDSRKWKKVSKLFINQYGDPFLSESLSAQSGKENEPENKEILDKIIKSVKNN